MKAKYLNLLILIFIISLPFSWVNIGSMSVYRVIAISCFGIWIISKRFQILIPLNDNRKLFFSWISYASYSIIAYFLFPSNTKVIFGMILLVLISFIFFSTEIDESWHKYIDYMWMIVGLLYVALFLFGKTAPVGWGTRKTLTILGTSTDANEFASFFVISLAIALYYFVFEKGIINRIFSGILLVSGLYVVFMAGSRGALISLAVSLFVTLFMSKKLSISNLIFILIFFVTLMIVLPKYILPLIPKDTLSRLTIEELINDNGSGRLDIWFAALDEYVHGNPLRWMLGYGYWGLTVNTWVGTTGTMHNQYVQQIISYGIIGLVLYMRLIFNIYKKLNHSFKKYKGAFLGMLCMGLTLSMGPSYKMLWILFFMAGISIKDVEKCV